MARAGRRIVLFFGACFLLVGAALLAVGGYRYARSTEQPATHPIVFSNLDEQGGIYERSLISTATPTPVPTDVPAAAVAPVVPLPPVPQRNVPYRIVIDKIGVNAAVAEFGLDRKQVPEVPQNGRDVAWYNFSARPASGSNAVFAGHVTWSGRAVFYDLEDLAPGDRITVLSDNGATRITYTVNSVFLVDTDDPNSTSVMSPTNSDVITLITCGGDPYYVGGNARYDYTHRLIVRGSLTEVVSSEPVPAAAGG